MSALLCGQTEPLRMTVEVVALHDFSQPGAPITAWRTAIRGEHLNPDAHRGPRRENRAEAVADLIDLTGGDTRWLDASTVRELQTELAAIGPGYTCKECGGPSPRGVGYTCYEPGAAAASAQVTACPCGYSRSPFVGG
jgi:hypothetical protein